MIIIQVEPTSADRKTEVELKTLFTNDSLPNGECTFGVVTIPPGGRIPVTGMGAHEQDEYSYIVKGSLIVGNEKKEYTVKAGDATLIPAGEAHWCYNSGNEDVCVVWALVNKR